MKKLLISSLKFFSLKAVKFFLLRFNISLNFSYTSSVVISLEFVFPNFCLTFGENSLFFCPTEFSSVHLQHSAPDLLIQQVAPFALQQVAPFFRTQTTTNRQTSLLDGSDRHVLGELHEAYPRMQRHRTRRPRETLCRRTAASSRAL